MFQMSICEAGYYCPDPQYPSQNIACPPQYFCPLGSIHPQICSFKLISCPQSKTILPNLTNAIICLVTIGPLIYMIMNKIMHSVLQFLREDLKENERRKKQ